MPDAEVVELLSALVAIDSVNPDLVAGGAGELEVAAFVAHWLERAGLGVHVVDPRAGRPSVVASTRGDGPTLLLNGHLDTVGVAGMERPLEPRIEGCRLYGRGAYDMKGGVAAAMLAAARAAREGLSVVVAAVADEEVASVGTTAVLEEVRADAAIVCEPTELQLAIAHKGFAGFEIETRGRAAHGSRPELGVDAIAKMGRVLVELEELDRRVQAARRHPLLGPGSLHASLIEGGQEFSSYPERCLVTGERRTLPGETTADVERELLDVVARARAADAGVDAEVRLGVARDPFEIAESHPFVAIVFEAARRPEVVGMPFWADSALVAAAAIPTVLFGPVGAGAHALEEWVDLDSVARCRDVYLDVARRMST